MSTWAAAGEGLPVPQPTVDSQPFWEATAAGRLVLQRCRDCGSFRFPPSMVCGECASRAVVWVDAAGTGTVYSYTVVHRPPTPAFQDAVPYVVALIELDEGPRLMSNVVGCDPEAVHVDLRVRARFEPRCNQTLVMFAPDGG